jgi:hypothetical protein
MADRLDACGLHFFLSRGPLTQQNKWAISAYFWDVQGDVVTHWTEGSKYTRQFSEDGNLLVGGCRPTKGEAQEPGNTYDATMTRVK